MKIKKSAKIIESHYHSHGVSIELTSCEVIKDGERFIFDVTLNKGTKENLVFDRASDIQTALKLPLFQPFKEGLFIRLAVSKKKITDNCLLKMITHKKFPKQMSLPVGLGYDLRGMMYFIDLAKCPHALYAGSSRSGKSVGLRCLIASIAAKKPVSEVNLIIIDTGARDLNLFSSLPHLAYPIVKDAETASRVIFALVDEMERRISLSEDESQLLPNIICIFDEYISLIVSIVDKEKKKALTTAISKLLQRGRHSNIHMVMATQEATKQDMLLNLNNLTTRMAFACSSYQNSISILGESGAEKLPGTGAMLFKPPNNQKPIYLQGAFVSTDELEQLIADIASKSHDLGNRFVIPEINIIQQPAFTPDILDGTDSKPNQKKKELAGIIMWALSQNTISSSQIQKNFRKGRNQADQLLHELFIMGLISEKFAKQQRRVLPSQYDDLSGEVIQLLEDNGFASKQINQALTFKEGVASNEVNHAGQETYSAISA